MRESTWYKNARSRQYSFAMSELGIDPVFLADNWDKLTPVYRWWYILVIIVLLAVTCGQTRTQQRHQPDKKVVKLKTARLVRRMHARSFGGRQGRDEVIHSFVGQ
jgi:hypothetical protein